MKWSRLGPANRHLALAIVLAMVTAACTGETTPTTSTEPTGISSTSPTTGPGKPVTLADVVGGAQTVQDFFLHIDMRVGQEIDSESFYAEVLAKASAGAEEVTARAGGLEFSPVSGLKGTVVDAEGETIQHLSVDFGLMTPSGELKAQTRSGLPDELVEIFDAGSGNRGEVLVEIVSADYTQRREHVGPGDRTLIDLTFVPTLSPGDPLTMVYIFGQTLPGDPDEEAGLSPQELFAYRFDKGLISVLADAGGVKVIADEAAVAIEGSTLVSREIKGALVAAAGLKGFQAGATTANDFLKGELGSGYAVYTGNPADNYQIQLSADWPSPALCRGAPRPGSGNCTLISNDRAAMLIITTSVLLRCGTVAGYLNQRNASGGIPITELEALGFGVPQTPIGSTTTLPEDPSTTTPGETTSTSEPPPDPVNCNPPPLPSPQNPKPTGGTVGDVHLRTFDGLRYDNQAAGEFLVFENDQTSIQMRTEPVEGSDRASIATAIAVRIGDQKVSMHLGDETWIDGERVELTRGEVVGIGGAELLWGLPGWVIVWPDGTVARVRTFSSNLMLVINTESRSTGMLGDNDGNEENDLIGPDGTQFPIDAPSDFNNFYDTYIDSWRISPEESLFHYEAGESTESFSITGFPAGPASVDTLDPAARDVAEQVCATLGVTDESLFLDCVLDVAITDDPEFAYQLSVFQVAVQAATPPVPTANPETPTGGTSYISMGSTLIQLGSDPPVRDLNGFFPQWTCAADDGVFTIYNRFPETPNRQIEVNLQYVAPEKSQTGVESFFVLVNLNSNPYAWMQTYAEAFAGAIDTISYDGSNLDVTGELYLNDPYDPALFPLSALPEGANLTPFVLHASCG